MHFRFDESRFSLGGCLFAFILSIFILALFLTVPILTTSMDKRHWVDVKTLFQSKDDKKLTIVYQETDDISPEGREMRIIKKRKGLFYDNETEIDTLQINLKDWLRVR